MFSFKTTLVLLASSPLHITHCWYVLVLSDGFPMGTQEFLTQRGHEIYSSKDTVGVVQGIAVDKEGNVEAYADYRKNGKEGHAVVVERTST